MVHRTLPPERTYDQPNERKVHKNSIPRLGDLLFAPAMSIGIVAGYLYLGVSVESSQLPVFRLSTMILMAGLFLIYLMVCSMIFWA